MHSNYENIFNSVPSQQSDIMEIRNELHDRISYGGERSMTVSVQDVIEAVHSLKVVHQLHDARTVPQDVKQTDLQRDSVLANLKMNIIL